MSGINRDLDRYLRKRRDGTQTYSGPSWFDKMFSAADADEREHIAPRDEKKLHQLEEEIEHGEHELEIAHDVEERIADEQEERVGLYHSLVRFFRGNKEPQQYTVEEVELESTPNDGATEDFRRLAAIQMRWLGQMPLRMRQAFKDSADYDEMTEILERRGVARKR